MHGAEIITTPDGVRLADMMDFACERYRSPEHWSGVGAMNEASVPDTSRVSPSGGGTPRATRH